MVIILGIIGGIVTIALLLGGMMTWRDRRRGARERSASAIWRSTVRGEHRDARASVGGQRISPDLRWTEWSRRNHPPGR
jgi:FtsZ-interacting cell division protein ZipA